MKINDTTRLKKAVRDVHLTPNQGDDVIQNKPVGWGGFLSDFYGEKTYACSFQLFFCSVLLYSSTWYTHHCLGLENGYCVPEVFFVFFFHVHLPPRVFTFIAFYFCVVCFVIVLGFSEHGFQQEPDGDAEGLGQGRGDGAKVPAGVHGGQADVLPRNPRPEHPDERSRQAQDQGRGERSFVNV